MFFLEVLNFLRGMVNTVEFENSLIYAITFTLFTFSKASFRIYPKVERGDFLVATHLIITSIILVFKYWRSYDFVQKGPTILFVIFLFGSLTLVIWFIKSRCWEPVPSSKLRPSAYKLLLVEGVGFANCVGLLNFLYASYFIENVIIQK